MKVKLDRGKLLKLHIPQFFHFAFLSMLGWLCDFVTFTLLVKMFGVPGFFANFVSSYVGVTFAFITTIRAVFKRSGEGGNTFLFIYWVFQLVSISAYSQLLAVVVNILPNASQTVQMIGSAEITAKIIITPFNLITNFLFLKLITSFMHPEQPTHA